jgi:hypothetical protein
MAKNIKNIALSKKSENSKKFLNRIYAKMYKNIDISEFISEDSDLSYESEYFEKKFINGNGSKNLSKNIKNYFKKLKAYSKKIKKLPEQIRMRDIIIGDLSDIRDSMLKLQMGKQTGSYLPLSSVSDFLGNLGNIDIHGYLNEVSKKPLHYKLLNVQENIDVSEIGRHSKESRENPFDFESSGKIVNMNSHTFFRNDRIIDQFSIFHKNLTRPGLQEDPYSKYRLNDFTIFKNNETLLDRGIKYGLGSLY